MAGAVFGDVGRAVSLRGDATFEIWIASRSAKWCVFPSQNARGDREK